MSVLLRVVVVPCFNEARRLDGEAMLRLVDERTHLLFVDDGSTDDTRAVLHALSSRDPRRVAVLEQPRNGGKAAAVRSGMLRALQQGADVVAFLDADLSTPVDEMKRLLAVLDDNAEREVVLGSRVSLLGRRIEREPMRHYLGRAFATMASVGLGLRVYDTQCGAKAFRASSSLHAALEQPFTSRWAFDVELIARLLQATSPEAFEEVPLRSWHDVKGSKLHPGAMVKAGLDVVRITARARLRR